MAVGSEATAPSCYGHTSALAFQPPLYMCVYCKTNPFSASGATLLRFAVRLRIPKPMLPSPVLG